MRWSMKNFQRERAGLHPSLDQQSPTPEALGLHAAGRASSSRHAPVGTAATWLDENEPRRQDHFLPGPLSMPGTLAMLGRSEEARRILAEQRRWRAEWRSPAPRTSPPWVLWVELWAGGPAAAAEFGAEGFELRGEPREDGLPGARGRVPGAGALLA